MFKHGPEYEAYRLGNGDLVYIREELRDLTLESRIEVGSKLVATTIWRRQSQSQRTLVPIGF
jgi:hypothetical protein